MHKPKYIDAVILSAFAILITFQPYFPHGTIDIYESGLYTPEVQALLNGEVPFRDFFYLRGPFELYTVALLMKLFGLHLIYLNLFFYVANVLCLVLGIFIAKEIFKTRWMLYLFVPVFVSRTWIRVLFMIWGGMRYVLGFLSLWLLIKFFQKEKRIWIFASGLMTAAGFFTSCEMGVCSFFGIMGTLLFSLGLHVHDKKFVRNALLAYAAGILAIAGPYTIYLMLHNALLPFVDATLTVALWMQKVLDTTLNGYYPTTLLPSLAAMLNPLSPFFDRFTPVYLYLFVLGYLIFRIKTKTIDKTDCLVFGLGIYGLILYLTGIRGLMTGHFEIALQPSKILLFFLFEFFFLRLWQNKSAYPITLQTGRHQENRRLLMKTSLTYVLVFSLVGSSLGYSITRFNHRFPVFKLAVAKLFNKDTSALVPYLKTPSRALSIERARGIKVPLIQADELETVIPFIENNVAPGETVFGYPDLGVYNFLSDRPYVGKFPMATLAWFSECWHNEFMAELETSKPRVVILQKEMPEGWTKIYLGQSANVQKHEQTLKFIYSNYRLVLETPLSWVFKRKP